MSKYNRFKYDILVLGGLGHVGLPLGIVFATKGMKVSLCDIDAGKAATVSKGKMPFIEYGAEPLLKKVINNGNLKISTDCSEISEAKCVLIAIGTPVDEYLSPKTHGFLKTIHEIKRYLKPAQLIIVRSTVYPHTCRQLLEVLGRDKKWKLAYCPERITQGYAIKELKELPQIVSGFSQEAIKEAAELFGKITPKIIFCTIEEAELVKLFSNAWRYIQFAITNQFYMIAKNLDVDYDKVRYAMMEDYGRNTNLPTAGFAAGPCLLKDTMMVSAFSGNNFLLGHSGMMINEGLPNFIVDKLREKHDLRQKKVGILGMAFKADIDDRRDSLSYKLRKILLFYGAKVLCSDEFIKDQGFVTKEELIRSSDIVIIGAPHSVYKNMSFSKNIELIDLWGITKKKIKK